MLTGNTHFERVIVVHKDNHTPVFNLTTDALGDWSANIPAGQPFMVIYIDPAGHCAPLMHGPYFAP